MVLTGYVRVHTGRGSNDSNDLYWGSGWYIWNNTGDRATLKNASGTVIDRCRYAGGGLGEELLAVDDLFFAAVEVAALLAIVWSAWRWRGDDVPVDPSGHAPVDATTRVTR